MALVNTTLPFGLRQVRVTPLDNTDAPGTSVQLVNSQTFSFSEAEDFEELRGDDGVVAIRGKGPKCTWTLEAGGMTLAAWAVIAGGTVTLTGTTPAQKRLFRKTKTDARPYFQVEGQCISDSGGDFHALVYKCKANGNLQADMADGKWVVPQITGEGIPTTASGNALYDLVQNETAVTPT